MRIPQSFSLLMVALLLPCPAAFAKHGDGKNSGRPISAVTSNFQLLNAVVRSGEPIKIRVTLHNDSASLVEFRYVTGSFIEHIRIYDAHHRQVPARLNAPFLESGADKVNLQPGEQSVNVVTADLWQMYDLPPGTYELRFYYDLRLIADETLAAKSMKRYHSKDWIMWDLKTYPLTVIDAEVSDATRNSPEPEPANNEPGVRNPDEARSWTETSDASNLTPSRTVALVSTATESRLLIDTPTPRASEGKPLLLNVTLRNESTKSISVPPLRFVTVKWSVSDATGERLERGGQLRLISDHDTPDIVVSAGAVLRNQMRLDINAMRGDTVKVIAYFGKQNPLVSNTLVVSCSTRK